MGYFGPGIRLFMGATFSFALALASEFIRRRDLRIAALNVPTEHIPAILDGVSVLSGFGVIYAAYALYGFIGASTAVGMMGALGLAALATSLVHGPFLACSALPGPISRHSWSVGPRRNFLALSVFIAVVTAAAFLIERLRPSALLLGGAIFGHAIWTVLIALTADGGIWAAFLLTTMTLLAIVRLEAGKPTGVTKPKEPSKRCMRSRFTSPPLLCRSCWADFCGSSKAAALLSARRWSCWSSGVSPQRFATEAMRC